jgi:hypothetical protein
LTVTVKASASEEIQVRSQAPVSYTIHQWFFFFQEGAWADVSVKLGLVKLLQKEFDLCEEAYVFVALIVSWKPADFF